MMLYLDCAATSFPKPQEVLDEVVRCIGEYCGNPGRSGHRLSLASAEQIYRCRCRVCSFFHYESPERLIFVSGATHGLNLAIASFFKPGGHILISDLEHNATLRVVHALCCERGGSYDVFPHKGNVSEALESKIRPQTTMVVCTEASNVTGQLLPIAEISRICKRRGLELVIDGAQGAGHADNDLGTLYFSAYCASSHKALYGIQGSGFVIFGRDPLYEYMRGGTGVDSFSREMPSYLPERYEAGTPSTPAIVSLLSGIEYLESHPQMLSIAQNCGRMLEKRIQNLPLRIYSQYDNPCGIVSFAANGIPSDQFAERMSQKGICVRGGLHCAPLAHQTLGTQATGLVRVSFGIFHTERDVDMAANAIEASIKET